MALPALAGGDLVPGRARDAETPRQGVSGRCAQAGLCPAQGSSQALERETGFEPATSTLARLRSTE